MTASRGSNRKRNDSGIKAAWIQAGGAVAAAVVGAVLGAVISWSQAKKNAEEQFYEAFKTVEHEVYNEYNGENMTVINQYGDSYEYGVSTDSFEEFLSSVTENYKKLIVENDQLNEQNDQLKAQVGELISAQEDDWNQEREAEESVQGAEDPETTVLTLKPHDMKNAESYQEYEGDESFQMFGREYHAGFTIQMAAYLNIWGDGEQYAVFNVEDISRKYVSMQMLAGHVDGNDMGDIVLEIYLDKNLDEEPDITHVIKAEAAPEEIIIALNEAKAMIIKVSNQGGSTNMAGFGEIKFIR